VSDFLVISTSLNPKSNSRILCQSAYDELSQTESVEFIDLRELVLPLCDGDACYAQQSVQLISSKISSAKCVLMGTPVYNYYASASAKNLVELTGKAWSEKVVGFLCAAGGRSSYMSIMSLANSLMLDFRCLVIPRFVYSERSGFSVDGKPVSEIEVRIHELARMSIRLVKALQST
jgi:FMN reductase